MSGAARTIVIVGAGMAGCQAALELRSAGSEDRIVLLSAEADAPYDRPPLSKHWLKGEIDDSTLGLVDAALLSEKRIELRLGAHVEWIDRAARTVHGPWGSLDYDWLILAPGSRPRPLPLDPGATPVHTLHDLDSARRLRKTLAEARSLIVVGGGFIGLEIASMATMQGVQVTVVEALDRLLSRSLSEPSATYLQRLHENAGTRFLVSQRVCAIEAGAGGGARISLDNGTAHTADVLLAGIGVVPADDLAAAAGLDTADGILVDRGLRTSDPRIFAIGDAARIVGRVGSGRLESVQNARDQARVAALNILGSVENYDPIPWFWTEQCGVRAQMCGVPQNPTRDIVLRSPVGARPGLSVLRYSGGDLVGVEALSRPADFVAGRKLLQAGLSPKPDEALAPGFSLREFANRGLR